MTRGRKSKHGIRHKIIENLEKYPHTAAQLRSRMGSNQDAVQRHLEWLESMSVVRSFQKKELGGERTYWELV